MLHAMGLPPLPDVEAEQLLGLVARDKKARESGVGWVLPQDVGRGRWNVKVPADEVAAELAAFLAAPDA
jgi:3-dehydroquinate synthetase